ncbi:MAG: hypothetical protein U0W24_04990 [Bacteroidales bacterium]
MKATLTIILAIITNLGYGQTNPEDIILVYDSLNPNGKMILKNDLVSDLDSLSTFLLDETQEKILTQNDSVTIRKSLIGKWTLTSVERVNGMPFNLQSYQNIQFSEDGKFIFENPNDTVLGTWNAIKERNGNLHLSYNEPQIAIKDKEILKLLPKEQIDALTYSSETKAIKEIDDNTLVFMTFILENTENIDDMFYRLILTTYKRSK